MAATYFEEAATAVLESMFACADVALSAQPKVSWRLLRGMVHLRPGGSYQRLFGIDRATKAHIDGVGYVTSGNVLRWIEEHRCSVSIDVQRVSIHSWVPGGPVQGLDAPDVSGVPGDATRERMLGRDASHVHVVPLRTPGGSVDGVITLEASCKDVPSAELLWEACHEELEVLAGVGGAFIAARGLPLRPINPVSTDEFLPVVGKATAPLVELLRAFAPRDDTLLISGPMGSGKSRLARWCHERSQRMGQPFEVLDVHGLPEDLQLAHIVGWKRGAFTGAFKDNPGSIARASKGTLFLDEIDKLSLQAQAGLLRFIEERTYQMVGDDASGRTADVRLLVGTNADLRAAVRAGRFREDLFWRINVLPVRLPPLDERTDEIAGWAAYMLNKRRQHQGGEHLVHIEPEALKLLESLRWPGNLRQLDNILRRARALLPEPSGPGGDLVIQRRHIERALTLDADADADALVGLLWRTARAFVQEAERRQGRGETLPLDLTEAFRGMVLGAAVQAKGNRDDAFALLGQEALLKNRNHHRALRRELLHVRDLLGMLGGEVEPDLAELLAADEEQSDQR